ncbi:type 2 periplasmic-binding domain-containing protein [Paraburkholderia aspalathi]|jgi:hypothetical protein|uniref:hypothetical protein n=2 Tax=Paraburkholderia aspalathi TaxID=1324617 RepID=UPI001B00B509|nr:hypothetical protein [Paraburkholderia aspalathi]MCX4157749.1 hypothetical protein [Paraburkholderia aspalathi]MDN7167151.1 hypothetical protein [Paraburkholderia sp. SECH2]MDQ6395639.1 hypothetical protein [Paraburkholderia aspalathi]CAE6786267.1 hypothetical protein R20943_04554 [Paraburkholderia aspalathi]
MEKRKLLRFLTLGPSGSNHEFVTARYIQHHGLEEKASMTLVLSFDEAARMVIDGEADYIVQVAVHPSTADIVAKYRKQLFVIDAFVSSSKDMAVVTRVDIGTPRTLALQPATRDYVNTDGLTLIPETSTASVADGLLSGKYESGLTYSSLAIENPTRFRIDERIGTVDDPWIVYGRERLSDGQVVAWKESPAARAFHAQTPTRLDS